IPFRQSFLYYVTLQSTSSFYLLTTCQPPRSTLFPYTTLFRSSADLARYRLVVAPSMYLLTEASAKNLHRYVEGGGHLLVSYFSGIDEEHDTVHPGAYPGALREVLRLSIEEAHQLREHETVAVTSGDGGPALFAPA